MGSGKGSSKRTNKVSSSKRSAGPVNSSNYSDKFIVNQQGLYTTKIWGLEKEIKYFSVESSPNSSPWLKIEGELRSDEDGYSISANDKLTISTCGEDKYRSRRMEIRANDFLRECYRMQKQNLRSSNQFFTYYGDSAYHWDADPVGEDRIELWFLEHYKDDYDHGELLIMISGKDLEDFNESVNKVLELANKTHPLHQAKLKEEKLNSILKDAISTDVNF